MKKILLLVALVGLLGASARADSPDWATRISVSSQVSVSTSSTGTQLVAADPYAKKTCLMNSTTNYLLLGDADTTFSTTTTGSFRLLGTVATAQPDWICLDGPGIPYRGALRAVSSGAVAITIGVLREQ